MQLFLVRHGQTEWNQAGRAQGHTDIPLDETGIAQADALARDWRFGPVDRVLSSDLQRSLATAQRLAESLGRTVEVDPRLRETSFGEWEGENYRTVRQRLLELAQSLDLDEWTVHAPGGESRLQVWDRLGAVAEYFATLKGSVVVVGHGGALTLLLARLLDGNPGTARSLVFSNTGITELRARTDGGWRMVRYNDMAHWDQPSAPMVDTGAPTAR